MTTNKELNMKVEILTKEVKDLQESRAKADEERESLSAQICQLTSDNKHLTRQVQIMMSHSETKSTDQNTGTMQAYN